MRKKIFFLAFAVCLMGACSKTNTGETIADTHSTDPGPDPIPIQIAEAGYGSCKLPFAAATWQLPADVKLEDSIHDYSYCWAFAPYKQISPKDWKGIPFGFTFCLTLKNNSNGLITIPFPPQLVFSSSSSVYQNVLVINLGLVEIPAGAIKTIVVQGLCINKGREAPQTFNEQTGHFLDYAFGPSVIPPALQEIVDILKPKNITMADVLKADGTIDNTKIPKYSVIQKAIWEVTDEHGLTAITRKELAAL